jgi:hypothetical protein
VGRHRPDHGVCADGGLGPRERGAPRPGLRSGACSPCSDISHTGSYHRFLLQLRRDGQRQRSWRIFFSWKFFTRIACFSSTRNKVSARSRGLPVRGGRAGGDRPAQRLLAGPLPDGADDPALRRPALAVRPARYRAARFPQPGGGWGAGGMLGGGYGIQHEISQFIGTPDRLPRHPGRARPRRARLQHRGLPLGVLDRAVPAGETADVAQVTAPCAPIRTLIH